MNALHQHTLDSYRASRHGAPIPPPPGTYDWRAARELTSQAVLVRRADRAPGLLTRLTRLLRRRRPAPPHRRLGA
ncbi:hypothetical protein [Streptomyces sp. NPDC058953]|uniref:hypothetical protein n=1 Tax=unclassified Streptomyces TaxID=2593676 RepID=UPI0036B129CA